MTKVEIEEFLKGKGDFVQIDHLTRFLKTKEVPLEKKKFIYQKLADLYEKKGMFKEVAKTYGFLSEASIVFTDKIKYDVKAAEFYIKAGDFVASEASVKKAMVEANIQQRAEIFVQIKEFYKKQGEAYEKTLKRAQAIRIYERLLHMNLKDNERDEIKKKLMPLYEKTGKLKEYFSIKDNKFDSTV